MAHRQLPPGTRALDEALQAPPALAQPPTPTLSFAAGLAIGLSLVAGVGLGVVLFYLLMRRREPLSAPHIIAIDHQAEEPVRMLSGPPKPAEYVAAPQETRMRSLTLPQLGTLSMAVRVATGGREPTDVTLRVVGPPGGFGVFSADAAALNMPGIGTLPIGDTLLLPTGDTQRIRLKPRQPLYGRGSLAGVVVSVTMSEAVVRTVR